MVTYPHIISKYTIDPKAVVALLTLLHRRAYITAGDYVVGTLDDPGDNMALACALEAGAQYIVTGDPHLLNLKAYHGVQILSVADAAALFSAGRSGS